MSTIEPPDEDPGEWDPRTTRPRRGIHDSQTPENSYRHSWLGNDGNHIYSSHYYPTLSQPPGNIEDPITQQFAGDFSNRSYVHQQPGGQLQEPAFVNRSHDRDFERDNHEQQSPHSQSETLVDAASDSNETVTNPIADFEILLPVDHPDFDPFIHDTLLWPRPDVEVTAEELRRFTAALEQSRAEREYQEELARQDRFEPRRDLFERPGHSQPQPTVSQSQSQTRHPREHRRRVTAPDLLLAYQQQPQFNIPIEQQFDEQRAQRDFQITPEFPLAQNPVGPDWYPQNSNRERNWASAPAQQPFFEDYIPHRLGSPFVPDQERYQQHSSDQGNFGPGRHYQGIQTGVPGESVEDLFRYGYLLAHQGEPSQLHQSRTSVPLEPSSDFRPPQSGFERQPQHQSHDYTNIAAGHITPSNTSPVESNENLSGVYQSSLSYRRLTESGYILEMVDRATIFEREIGRLLDSRDAGDGVLERELEEKTLGLRDAVEQMVFEDPQYCYNKNISSRCWGTHHKVISRYSKVITALRNDGKKPVELRKAYHSFGKFIKLVTKYYRAHIQRLISHFGVVQLTFVAQEFKFEIDPSDQRRDFSSDIKNIIVYFCYETLIHLGDLSRYRESYGEPNPRKPNAKNWGPAKGYYSLARKVLPTHPRAFNQLAVLAQYEHNNFTGIFYLYRSLLAEDEDSTAHDTTLANLRVCFHKVLKDYAATEPGSSEDITHMFSRYHALCFLNSDASEYESLKSDLLNQITLAVKEKAIPATSLNRMILINIAAEHLALSRDRATMSSLKVVTFLRFNIETFTSLLIVLQQELDGTSQDGPGPANGREAPGADLVSAVMRRMLPSLRLYSAWLLISHNILVNETSDMSLNVQVKQLWQTYATTLSLLLSAFPKTSLTSSQYILEEDDDIAGFKPLMDISDSRRLGKELAKEQQRDHPNEESLARILYLIEDGIELCTEETVPIEIKNSTFAFQDGIISTDSNTGNAEYPTITLRDIPVNPSGVRATSTASRLGQANPMGSVISEPVSTTLTNKMNAMVDDLVGSTNSRDSDDEDEIVVWKGRKPLYQSMPSAPKAGQPSQVVNTGTVTSKTPMIAQALSNATPATTQLSAIDVLTTPPQNSGRFYAKHPNYFAPYAETVTNIDARSPVRSGNRSSDGSQERPLNARDIVSMVENYTSRMSISQSGPGNAAIPSSSNAGGSIPQADPVTPKLSAATIGRTDSMSEGNPHDHPALHSQHNMPQRQPQYAPHQPHLQSIFPQPTSSRTAAYRNPQYNTQQTHLSARDRLMSRNGTPIQYPAEYYQSQQAQMRETTRPRQDDQQQQHQNQQQQQQQI